MKKINIKVQTAGLPNEIIADAQIPNQQIVAFQWTSQCQNKETQMKQLQMETDRYCMTRRREKLF